MVDQITPRLDHVFHALSDRTRRAIIGALAAGPHTVSELSEPFAMSLAAVSKHVKVLERARLVRRDIRGREHRCSLDPSGLGEAAGWLAGYERFWNARLDALAALLEEEAAADSGVRARSKRKQKGARKR